MTEPPINTYQRGKIYKLTSTQTNDIYIGSTCAYRLSTRLSNHKATYKNGSNSTTAVKILQYDDVKIELIEKYPTTSEYLLLEREGYWIKKLDCVNQILPG